MQEMASAVEMQHLSARRSDRLVPGESTQRKRMVNLAMKGGEMASSACHPRPSHTACGRRRSCEQLTHDCRHFRMPIANYRVSTAIPSIKMMELT